jgi:hypothetical protein
MEAFFLPKAVVGLEKKTTRRTADENSFELDPFPLPHLLLTLGFWCES